MTKKETKRKLKALGGIKLSDAIKEGLVDTGFNLDDGNNDFYKKVNADAEKKNGDNDNGKG